MSEQTGSWQPDPFGRNQYRYWDGAQWTDQVSNDGVVTTDPAVAEVAAPEAPAAEAVAPEPPASESPGWAAGPEPAPTEPAPTEAVPTAAVPPTAVPAASYAAPAAGAAPGSPGHQDPAPPAAAGGGGGGSKLPLVIVGVGLLALILGAGAYFLFFSGDDEDDAVRADLIAGLRSDMGLSQSDAECVVDELSGSTDLATLARAIDNDDDPTAAQLAAILNAFDRCDLDAFALDGDEPDDVDDTTTDPDDVDGDDTDGGFAIPPAMVAVIAQQMADELGLTQSEAECFVEGLFDNLSDGDFESLLTGGDSPDFESMGWMMQVFTDCGIDPTTLDGGSGGVFPGGSSGSGGSYGDDPALDALWDACEGGDMQACDDLYFDAPFGSAYGVFADTCGGRQAEGTGNLCTVEFG